MKLQAYKVNDYVAALKPHDAPALILVYGPDEGGVRETGKALKRAYLGGDFDPLQYVAMGENAAVRRTRRAGR